MATIFRRQTPTADTSLPVHDWSGFAQVLHWPAGLSLKERALLFRRGKRDARHGLVNVNEYGEISSPFCETLVQAANQRIELEWLRCSEMLEDSFSAIKQADMMIGQLEEQLRMLTIQRDEALDAVGRRHYDGDDVVSEHLANRRRQNREKPVRDHFDALAQTLHDQLISAEFSTVPHRYAISQAEDRAESNEQLVRADYLWRLSVYAYGASNYIKVTPDMINDTALTDTPRKRHKKLLHDAEAQEPEKQQ